MLLFRDRLVDGFVRRGEVGAPDLLLVDLVQAAVCRVLVLVLVDDGPQFGEGHVFAFGRDDDRLDEELVAAFRARGRVVLHRLEQDLHLDRLARLDPARVGTDAVLLGRGRLDLVRDRVTVVVRDGQGALDERRERALREER